MTNNKVSFTAAICFSTVTLILVFTTLALGQNKAVNTPVQVEKNLSQSISGEYMKAFVVAYDAFRKSPGLKKSKKSLDNYNLEFSEDAKNYVVHFHVKPLPGTVTGLGGETTIGREEQFTIAKSNSKIVQDLLYR